MPDQLAVRIELLTHRLASRHFPELARALHAGVPAMVRAWRARSLEDMPYLDTLSTAGFVNSIATTLHLLANALECNDPARLQRLIEESPAHGLLRFLQHFGPETLLAEERILRSVVISGLRHEMGRSPTAEEAAALHDLLDLMRGHSLLALIHKRGEERDRMVQARVSGMHRLADLGTLVAGVAHDATNLLLPLRMHLEHLRSATLSPDLQEDLASIELIIEQFQNSIVNLRWLSVNADRDAAPSLPASRAPLLTGGPSRASLRLQEWAVGVSEFHRRMLPPHIRLGIEIGAEVPPAAITSAALSQAVFNLIHNASQAISSMGPRAPGIIMLRAEAGDRGTIRIAIEDHGPGMSDEVLRRSTEAFFTTRASGSGLGLAVVQALLTGFGGTLRFWSPPPGKARGTVAVIIIPMARAS